MKSQIMLICTLFSFFTSFSQIVLTMEDLPKQGDVVLRARVDSLDDLLIEPGEAGENISWEFSWMNFYGGSFNAAADSVMWINNLNTPESDSFLQADIAQRTNCYFFHNWQTHAITLECYNKYFIKDIDGLHLFGSTYPNVHQFVTSRNIFPLLNYGDTLVESSREVIQISSDSIYITNIIDTTIVDGWGTIHTPIDDLDALRFYTTETVWDSLYVNNVGEQINYQPDNYYYRWYTKGVGNPVFQISKGILEYQSQYKVSRFIMELKRLEISDNSIGSSEFQVSPNPSNSGIKFTWKKANNIRRWTIYIYDINSRPVIIQNNICSHEWTLESGTLNNGMYFYKIVSDNSNSQIGKIVIL